MPALPLEMVFPNQGSRTSETFIMEGAGVVVGDWVEWWSGIGWSGGRGLGGVMVEDWLGDGLGCGGCWSGCVVGVGSYMALAAGEGECACELLVWLMWCPELYTLNTSPLETNGPR